MSDAATPMGETTLRDHASVIWRRKWVVILPALAIVAVAVGLSLAQTPQYRASAQVLVKTPPNAYSLGSTGETLSPRLVENELLAAQGSALVGDVRTTIGAEPSLSVSVAEGSDVFTFTATSSNPDLAAAAANTYATTYIERQRTILLDEYATREQVLRGQLAAIDRGEVNADRRGDYEFELEDLAVSIELARTSGSILIAEATTPSTPFEPNTTRTAILALTVGLLIGLAAAFLFDYLDTSIRDEDDVIRATGLANLASIPQVAALKKQRSEPATPPTLVTRELPRSPAAEAFRTLQTAVRFLGIERTMRVVLVTSPSPGEGKSTTAANLAITAARAGQRVALVDCDLRRPQMHRLFDVPNDRGLTSVLLGETTATDAAITVAEGTLAVIPSGPLPPNASELLAGQRIERVLEELQTSFDLVVVDSPPVLSVSDPAALASVVDGVIVVAAAGSTDRRRLTKAIDRLMQVDAPILGTVVNRVAASGDGDYGYGYRAESASHAQHDVAGIGVDLFARDRD